MAFIKLNFKSWNLKQGQAKSDPKLVICWFQWDSGFRMTRPPNPIPNYPFQLQFLNGLLLQIPLPRGHFCLGTDLAISIWHLGGGSSHFSPFFFPF